MAYEERYQASQTQEIPVVRIPAQPSGPYADAGYPGQAHYQQGPYAAEAQQAWQYADEPYGYVPTDDGGQPPRS
jgi:hypothetical protein